MVRMLFYRIAALVKLQLFDTVRTIHLLFVKDETLVGQICRALFAVEAEVMPEILFMRYHIRS